MVTGGGARGTRAEERRGKEVWPIKSSYFIELICAATSRYVFLLFEGVTAEDDWDRKRIQKSWFRDEN